jgi:hypothetical protein
MEKACLAWEKCMNRDPTVVGRARVSAETFAEIVNSFIEPISYKTMVIPREKNSLFKVILSSCGFWIGVFIEFCVWVVTTTGSDAKIRAVSSSAPATDTDADA